MNPPSETAPDQRAEPSADVFQRAFHASPALQSIVRFSDGVFVEVNATFLRVFGYDRSEIIGKTPKEFSFWVKPELLTAYRAQLGAEGRVRDFEVEVRNKDGSVRTVLLSSELVEIDGVPHALSAGVDITARKRAEAELRVTATRLSQTHGGPHS